MVARWVSKLPAWVPNAEVVCIVTICSLCCVHFLTCANVADTESACVSSFFPSRFTKTAIEPSLGYDPNRMAVCFLRGTCGWCGSRALAASCGARLCLFDTASYDERYMHLIASWFNFQVVWRRPRNPKHQGPVTRSTPVQLLPFLNMTRSLGDLWSLNSARGEYVVSPEPEISFRCLASPEV